MMTEEKRRAAELLKDLIVERKGSRWPIIVGLLFVIALIGAGLYWIYLPVKERPDVPALASWLLAKADSFMNAPVGPASTSPKSKPPEKKGPPAPAGDTGLLSN